MTLDDFLREPTKLQWCREITEHGWRGPDGSSCSLDAIMGIRIGIKDPRYEFHLLPANAHDWRHQLGRRLDLPWEWSIPSDHLYLTQHQKRMTDELVGPWLWVALWICWARYTMLRIRAHALRLVGFPVWGGPP
jgi:hypothetical protein